MHRHFLLMLALIPALSAAPALAQDDELERRIERLERVLESQILDVLERLDDLQRELRQVRGGNEQNRHELESIKNRQRELYLNVDRRLRELESGGLAERDGAPPLHEDELAARSFDEPERPPTDERELETIEDAELTQADAPPEPSPQPSPGEAREAYSSAFSLLTAERYEAAVEAFTAFLENYPDSAYSANAQYWLAEAHYVRREFGEAAEAFRKVIDEHPQSNKAPDAKLKLGYTYYELEEWDRAHEMLTELQQQNPGSAAAKLAGQRLERMRTEGR